MQRMFPRHACRGLIEAPPERSRASPATPGFPRHACVLQPNDPDNYYRVRELVPTDIVSELTKAKIVITNFHAFKASGDRLPQ